MRLLLVASLALVACLATACEDKPADTTADKPTAAADGYTTTPSGLKYKVLRKGEAGTEPQVGDKVSVKYVGTFPDGKEFDRSDKPGRPPTFDFVLGTGGVIPGWDEGVALMTIGSKYHFQVPWKLAYGELGRGTIPPKADLEFDVELVAVEKPVRFSGMNDEKSTTTKSGLKYEVLELGDGAVPTKDEGVTFKFALYSPKGLLLESSEKSGATLSGAVPALPLPFLKEAALLMKTGGKLRCAVPAKLGFGARPLPEIPPGSTTYWELSLEGINEVPDFALSPEDKKQKTESGLEYEVLAEGEGPHPKASDRVEVHYTGWLTDGTLFDSSHGRGETTSFPLGRVIPGWTEGLQLMRPGGKMRFTIPGKLAYGPRGQPPTIPPGATLVFLIELKKIN